MNTNNRPVVLACSGASGQIYAKWLLKLIIENCNHPVRIIVSNAARKIILDELGTENFWSSAPAGRISIENDNNMESELASGSNPTTGMIVCPCSLNTLAGIAAGISDTLIKRCAQVHLKQRRKLILAVREMPIGIIDLENMLKISHAGGIAAPLSPPFYHHPQNLDQLANFTAQKLLQLLIDYNADIRYTPA